VRHSGGGGAALNSSRTISLRVISKADTLRLPTFKQSQRPFPGVRGMAGLQLQLADLPDSILGAILGHAGVEEG